MSLFYEKSALSNINSANTVDKGHSKGKMLGLNRMSWGHQSCDFIENNSSKTSNSTKRTGCLAQASQPHHILGADMMTYLSWQKPRWGSWTGCSGSSGFLPVCHGVRKTQVVAQGSRTWPRDCSAGAANRGISKEEFYSTGTLMQTFRGGKKSKRKKNGGTFRRFPKKPVLSYWYSELMSMEKTGNHS